MQEAARPLLVKKYPLNRVDPTARIDQTSQFINSWDFGVKLGVQTLYSSAGNRFVQAAPSA